MGGNHHFGASGGGGSLFNYHPRRELKAKNLTTREEKREGLFTYLKNLFFVNVQAGGRRRARGRGNINLCKKEVKRNCLHRTKPERKGEIKWGRKAGNRGGRKKSDIGGAINGE